MKLYQLTFMDIERGKVQRWRRSKRENDRLIRYWAKAFPMRELLLVEQVDIPNGKDAFVSWLNDNCGGG